MSTTPRRAALVAALGSPCPYCGEPLNLTDRPPTRDHVEPRCRGHTLEDNCAIVCMPCNVDKGDASIGDFLAGLCRAGDARKAALVAFVVERGHGPCPAAGACPSAAGCAAGGLW